MRQKRQVLPRYVKSTTTLSVSFKIIDFSKIEGYEGPKLERKKVLVILPGVTGCSQANYVKEMVLGAHKNGFQAVVINSLVTKDTQAHLKDYRVLDFSDSLIIRESLDLIH